MRVAIGIHKNDVESAIETYNWWVSVVHTCYTNVFNAGTPKPQLSSSAFCWWWKTTALTASTTPWKTVQKFLKRRRNRLSMHNIRATVPTSRTKRNIKRHVPMLACMVTTQHVMSTGWGKRKGLLAIYLEPWHADVFDFLDLKKNHGKEENRARDLFYATLDFRSVHETLWRRRRMVSILSEWSSRPRRLLWKRIEELYALRAEGRARNDHQSTGNCGLQFLITDWNRTPYSSTKSVQWKEQPKNLGTIKSSNLCTEIVEYTSKDEIAVCNLASCVATLCNNGAFDHQVFWSHVCDHQKPE